MSEDDGSRGSHRIDLKRYASPNVNPNGERVGGSSLGGWVG